ncbi:MAG TPA: GNAT family N-acetyltransferase, partial [Vulgatibacter sp.]
FRLEDYETVLALWKASAGVGLSDADSRGAIEVYLQRNPGMSFLAYEDDELVGAVLCGHDGRRGLLHHLAVARSHRGRGVGRRLAELCLEALKRDGIQKAHLFVYHNNHGGVAFWKELGWYERTELRMMSCDIH